MNGENETRIVETMGTTERNLYENERSADGETRTHG